MFRVLPVGSTARAPWFLLFVAAYYAPLLVDSPVPGLEDPSARSLAAQALGSFAVWPALLQNLLGHLLPLAACYVLLDSMSRQFASVTRVGAGLSTVLFLLVGLVFLASLNVRLFPSSDYAMVLAFLDRPMVLLSTGSLLLGGAVVALVAAKGIVRRVVVASTTLAVAGFGTAMWPGEPLSGADGDARNVIVIGVDSLSPQTLAMAGNALPNINGLVAEGVSYERAYTPLARTFPAWVSLLSGRPPAEHGAIFNLRSLEQVERADLVTRVLKARGYRTVYAIDERRFSNLDESFGFDRVVGPKAGALDFVLQRINDTPLTNLLLQMRLSGALLPYSRNNVASHANYDALGFVEEIVSSLNGAGRVMLAVHFESAHFPFKSRHAQASFADDNSIRGRQLAALTVVDAQIGYLLRSLADGGYLGNALVVLLSDHGESFGSVEAIATREGDWHEISAFGHGANLMSEHQSRIVMSVARYRGGKRVGTPATRDEQVSIRDVRSLIERFADTGEAALEPSEGCMDVETGLRITAASDYNAIDEAEVVAESARFYEVDASGRLRLREAMLPALVSGKDVGLRCRDRITLWVAAEERYRAYEIDSTASRFVEVEARSDDAARIARYRARLIDSASAHAGSRMAGIRAY